MPEFTIRFAVDIEAANAWEAVNEVERRLATFELLASHQGVEFRTDAITDEMGEEVHPTRQNVDG